MHTPATKAAAPKNLQVFMGSSSTHFDKRTSCRESLNRGLYGRRDVLRAAPVVSFAAQYRLRIGRLRAKFHAHRGGVLPNPRLRPPIHGSCIGLLHTPGQARLLATWPRSRARLRPERYRVAIRECGQVLRAWQSDDARWKNS